MAKKSQKMSEAEEATRATRMFRWTLLLTFLARLSNKRQEEVLLYIKELLKKDQRDGTWIPAKKPARDEDEDD